MPKACAPLILLGVSLESSDARASRSLATGGTGIVVGAAAFAARLAARTTCVRRAAAAVHARRAIHAHCLRELGFALGRVAAGSIRDRRVAERESLIERQRGAIGGHAVT